MSEHRWRTEECAHGMPYCLDCVDEWLATARLDAARKVRDRLLELLSRIPNELIPHDADDRWFAWQKAFIRSVRDDFKMDDARLAVIVAPKEGG